MAQKFKIGDVVEVVKQSGAVELPCKIGFKGRIRMVVETFPYPYCVQSLNNKCRNRFNVRELKLIKRKGD